MVLITIHLRPVLNFFISLINPIFIYFRRFINLSEDTMRFLFIVLTLLHGGMAFSQTNYEFRGVWIATVDNIDWPQKGVYTVYSQKTEFIRQLDMHQQNGMNAVIVQVRPAADAFYPSSFEPWSQWLTGRAGPFALSLL